jgi:hypothetical protein
VGIEPTFFHRIRAGVLPLDEGGSEPRGLADLGEGGEPHSRVGTPEAVLVREDYGTGSNKLLTACPVSLLLIAEHLSYARSYLLHATPNDVAS